MVERRAENAGVGSPILPLGTILLRRSIVRLRYGFAEISFCEAPFC